MCGGKNSKTPGYAAIWRQGHLLHFGFHQTPSQLNANGRAMLANSIVYISRFTEDRPLGLQRMGPTWPRSRRILRNTLDYKGWKPVSTVRWFAETCAPQLRKMDNATMKKWIEANEGWFYAMPDGKIDVDLQARTLGIRLDAPDFVDKALEALADPAKQDRIRRVLARAAPEGPADGGSALAWTGWLTRNKPYLFYSEGAGYHWLLDPLAKKRKIPSRQLRGAARASQPARAEPGKARIGGLKAPR